MIPVHVGIMTPTSAVMMPTMQIISKPAIHKKEILRIRDNNENSGPTTTVFVGNISEKASDMLIRQLLAVSNGKGFTNMYSGKIQRKSTEHGTINIMEFDYISVCGQPAETGSCAVGFICIHFYLRFELFLHLCLQYRNVELF